jgi:hypothetical protein
MEVRDVEEEKKRRRRRGRSLEGKHLALGAFPDWRRGKE